MQIAGDSVAADPALQSVIDALVKHEPASAPCPPPEEGLLRRPRRRRVRFSHKLVYSIPHWRDDGRRPPAWTRVPSPPDSPSGDVCVYNDSDDDVEERIYVANVAQNLYVAALHRMLNSGGAGVDSAASDDGGDYEEYLDSGEEGGDGGDGGDGGEGNTESSTMRDAV